MVCVGKIALVFFYGVGGIMNSVNEKIKIIVLLFEHHYVDSSRICQVLVFTNFN